MEKATYTLQGIFTIGITGGIGSGKSVVADILRSLSIPVFDSDQEAKKLYDTDLQLREQMIALWGERLYQTPTKTLDRRLLSSIIFSDPKELEKVNALVHPSVRRRFSEWRERQLALGYRCCALESALLAQGGLRAYVDSSLVVIADDDLRLRRAMQRDRASQEQIQERMTRQASQSELISQADFVLHNEDDRAVLPQLMDYLRSLPPWIGSGNALL